MTNPTTDTIARVLARAPDWLRHDLVSDDPALRIRAEDTLAAMIAAALSEEPDPS